MVEKTHDNNKTQQDYTMSVINTADSNTSTNVWDKGAGLLKMFTPEIIGFLWINIPIEDVIFGGHISQQEDLSNKLSFLGFIKI